MDDETPRDLFELIADYAERTRFTETVVPVGFLVVVAAWLVAWACLIERWLG